MSNTEKQTLVEEGTEFAGTMTATCKVVVRGAVDGELRAPAVDVTETGIVTGTVRAEHVSSKGVLAGTVEADAIVLAGEVRSNTVLRAKTLEVKLSAEQGRLEVTFGDCVVDVGDLPAKEDIVAPTDEASVEADGDGRGKRKRKRTRKTGEIPAVTDADAEEAEVAEVAEVAAAEAGADGEPAPPPA